MLHLAQVIWSCWIWLRNIFSGKGMQHLHSLKESHDPFKAKVCNLFLSLLVRPILCKCSSSLVFEIFLAYCRLVEAQVQDQSYVSMQGQYKPQWKYWLAWVRVGMSLGWLGFGLVWVLVGFGLDWFGSMVYHELAWASIVMIGWLVLRLAWHDTDCYMVRRDNLIWKLTEPATVPVNQRNRICLLACT
jgi:hypothetical protein